MIYFLELEDIPVTSNETTIHKQTTTEPLEEIDGNEITEADINQKLGNSNSLFGTDLKYFVTLLGYFLDYAVKAIPILI